MSVSGIHGHILEVTVIGCNKLKDTEWISRQDPYVCVEYGSTKCRTRTCTDGGKAPVFQERFTFTLIEGLREINVVVWNSNTLTFDDFIGSEKVQLNKVLSQGFDDAPWPLQTKTGRYAGEVRLIMHYANAKHQASAYAPTAPPYAAPPPPQVPQYSVPPPTYSASYPPPATTYPTSSAYPSYPSFAYPPPPSAYPPPPSAYPPPPAPSSYPQSTYPPPSSYPPSAYPPPSSYPPSTYPPPSSYPPGPFPGLYPLPPY
ncbi:protein SRC2 homolog [Hibiscus syriacus]|uniref:protein SRC2 homolog n=1 Tax=Hibiscus syriacus TaxID=106335 RepID=UPI001922ECEB|nr:protein SRC2 homolog [Hibiscus syriacus]